MGNSISVDAVSPPLEYASDEGDKIPFVPYGDDPMLNSLGTAMRVRPKTGRIAGVEVAVRKTIHIMKDDKERICRAVAQLSQVRHPHMLRTITTYFYNGHNGVQFSVVTDFVQDNLCAYLAEPARALHERWFGCLIEAVAYLHQRGIRHRDIKPESILVRDGNTVLLSNFDVAEIGAQATRQTVRSLKWGHWKMTGASSRYGAPETDEDRGEIPAGRPADIFSLGAVFLEMLLAGYDQRCSLGGEHELGPQLESKLGSPNGTAKPYAQSVDVMGSWLAGLTLSSPRSADEHGQGWEAKVLSLCRAMLDPEPGGRPRADELSCWWKSVAGKNPSLRCTLCDGHEAQGDDATGVATNVSSGTDATGGPQETDLFHAAGRWPEGEVRALLREEAAAKAVNAQNMDGWSPLHYAARMDRPRVVGLLLNAGAKIELVDDAGWTALHFAANGGHKDVLERLLVRGADATAATRRGHTPLHLAAKAGHAGAVEMLLKEMDKAAVNKKTKQGHSAIWMAAAGDHREVLKLLVDCDKVDIRAPAK